VGFEAVDDPLMAGDFGGPAADRGVDGTLMLLAIPNLVEDLERPQFGIR
jgi:hypothetical protein